MPPSPIPIDIVQLQDDFIVSADNVSMAELEISMGPVPTEFDTRITHMTFANVPFAVFADKLS